MAECFAPFIIERTIRNLTFYRMDGRNFVRKKSSLTRRKVLYAPQFANTRHYAGLMAKASAIGSKIYKQLPDYWRQFWMFQSFTGEALKLLKKGVAEADIIQGLYDRYVKLIVDKPIDGAIVVHTVPPKRSYRKQHPTYWHNKTIKKERRKLHRQKLMHHAGILASASRIGSLAYRFVPLNARNRSVYLHLTGFAMQLLKAGWEEADVLSAWISFMQDDAPLTAVISKPPLNNIGQLHHSNGYYYFTLPLLKRILPVIALTDCKNKHQLVAV